MRSRPHDAPPRPLAARAAALLLTVLLGACATLPAPVGDLSPSHSPRTERAETLYAQGDLHGAAAEYLSLARSQRGDMAAFYRLRAGEVLRDAGDLDGAERALGDIHRRRLDAESAARLDLLDAEIALHRGDAARAKAMLLFDEASLSPSLRLRALELRARAELADGNPLASAQMRALLDRELRDADRDHNRQQLQEALSRVPAEQLRARHALLSPQDPLRPWIELALNASGQSFARTLPQPSRPVGTTLADGAPEGYAPPHRVGLLLPASQLDAISQSIRDGFLTAYFADDPRTRPEVRIYDSGARPEDAIAAYRAAVADGADLVVGPLQREAVGALFREPLATRVLALNHPDSGEVPPPGSAEFGLLPDTEGAQAAERMLARGIGRAAIVASDADWAERAARAFRAQFEAGGGSVVAETRIGDKDIDYSGAVRQAMPASGDGGGVFISVRPQQGRLLVPQLRVAGIGDAIFATSHINAADGNVAMDRDLDGIEFCDAPWLFAPIAGRPSRNAVATRLASANGFGGRLFAFGMDAYALVPYLDWLAAHPDAYIAGATGELTADSFGRVHRLVGWARFRYGVAEPADGALGAFPDAR